MSAFSYLFKVAYTYLRCWVISVLVQPDTKLKSIALLTQCISIFMRNYIGIYGVGKHVWWPRGGSLLNAFNFLLDAIILRYLLDIVYAVCSQVVLLRPFMLRLSLRRNYKLQLTG